MIWEKYPQHIQDLVREIEQLAGCKVLSQKVPELHGYAAAELRKGKPVILYRELRESNIAEELLHLKLDFLGYPRLLHPMGAHLTKQVATILHNVFQHQQFYSQMEAWGYDPFENECRGVEKQMEKIESVELKRLQMEKHLRALFAMVYARTILDCKRKTLKSRVESFFAKPELSEAKEKGELVVMSAMLVTAGRLEEYCRGLKECLAHLELEDEIKIKGSAK